jgi:threonine aldolase
MVDLRSDTVTRPTPAMLEAMFSAPVGDDVLGDDPSCNRLEAIAAELAGKEAALFTPSGTMANQLAIRCWTQPGDEVLMHEGAHPYNYEAAAAAVISGVQIKTLPGPGGVLAPETVWAAIRVDNVHFAPATLVCVENTANRGGGSVYPQATLDAIAQGAHERGLKAHMDGARVFNASVASGVPLARMVRDYDSVAFCLSKGLGAPVGSILAGPAEVIHRARRYRKLLGGGMRQAGYLAGAGIYALEHHIERLEQDHARARRLFEGLTGLGFPCVEPETNMVYVTVSRAEQAEKTLAEAGIACLAVSGDTMRLVTHLDVDDAGIEATIAAFGRLGA